MVVDEDAAAALGDEVEELAGLALFDDEVFDSVHVWDDTVDKCSYYFDVLLDDFIFVESYQEYLPVN